MLRSFSSLRKIDEICIAEIEKKKEKQKNKTIIHEFEMRNIQNSGCISFIQIVSRLHLFYSHIRPTTFRLTISFLVLYLFESSYHNAEQCLYLEAGSIQHALIHGYAAICKQ